MKRHAPDSQNALLSALAPSATTCLQLDSTAASNIVTSLPPQHSCSVTTTTTSHLLCPKAEEDDDGNTCHCWHVCLCFFSLFFQMTDLFFSFFLSHLDTFSLCQCWRGGGEYRRWWLGEDKGKWQMAPGMFFVLFFSSFTNDTHYFYCLASPFSTNGQWRQHQPPPLQASACSKSEWVNLVFYSCQHQLPLPLTILSLTAKMERTSTINNNDTELWCINGTSQPSSSSFVWLPQHRHLILLLQPPPLREPPPASSHTPQFEV